MHELLTSGLASCGVYARGKFCGKLKVYRPFELLCSPARTPSRRPLYASGRQRGEQRPENDVVTMN